MNQNRLAARATGPLLLAGLISFSVGTTAGQDSPALHGSWVATAGANRTFRGRWVGQSLPGQPDALHGSWTLADDLGRTVATGTWSARRRGQGWRGTWWAQDEIQRSVSGTWKAEPGGTGGGSLQQLIERTLETEISGSWQSGRLQGQWWLKGSRAPSRTQ